MPKIFTKDCKINVIEYGASAPAVNWRHFSQDMWAQIKKIFIR